MSYRELDTEKVLAVVMIGIASYMFIEAFSFQGRVATFPQITASVVIVGGTLVLFQDYLPAPIQTAVVDTSALIEANEEQIPTDDDPAAESRAMETKELESDEFHLQYRPLITFALLVAYLGASYLFGFLLVSPVFVAAYTIVMRQPWYTVAITSVLSFVIVFAFMVVLNVPVDRGVLFPGVTW